MLFPRRTTLFIAGLAIGLAAGFAAGYNVGRGVPLLSSPFAKKRGLGGEIRRTSGRILEKTGDAMERGGRKLKRIFDR